MDTTVITKQLAGMEDLLLGKGTELQNRNNKLLSITKINLPQIVNTIDELKGVDTTKIVNTFLIGDFVSLYLYTEESLEENIPNVIIPNSNIGSWVSVPFSSYTAGTYIELLNNQISVVIPNATNTTLGLIKIGSGLSIDDEGTLSAATESADTLRLIYNDILLNKNSIVALTSGLDTTNGKVQENSNSISSVNLKADKNTDSINTINGDIESINLSINNINTALEGLPTLSNNIAQLQESLNASIDRIITLESQVSTLQETVNGLAGA